MQKQCFALIVDVADEAHRLLGFYNRLGTSGDLGQLAMSKSAQRSLTSASVVTECKIKFVS